MTQYVCGFYFDHLHKRVVLIWKSKPKWQAGHLNGVGGKIEPGETPPEAMRREFKEETGIDHEKWNDLITLDGEDWRVYFFCAEGKINEFEYAETQEAEEIAKIDVDDLDDFKHIPNLRWLIPMAIYKLRFPGEAMSFYQSPSPQLNAGEVGGKVLADYAVNESQRLTRGNFLQYFDNRMKESGFRAMAVHLIKEVCEKYRLVTQTDAPAAQTLMAKEKFIALIELYKTHIPEEKYDWADHVRDLDNIIFDIENNMQPTETPASAEEQGFYCTKPSDIPCYHQCESCRSVDPRRLKEAVPVQQGEVPKDVMEWIEEQVAFFSVPAARIAGKALAIDMHLRDQEQIKALQQERDQYKEWWEKSQANITDLTEQLGVVQGERDALRKGIEFYADPGNYTHDDNSNHISTAYENGKIGRVGKAILKKYPKQ